MRNYKNWREDLTTAVKAFEGIKDTYLPRVLSGKIHTIESKENEVLILLDQKSGIDYIREDDIGLQGVAARAQYGFDFKTFTIRYKRHTGAKTEYEKRLEAINNGYFYPFFTLHAYFDNKKDLNFKSLAIIKTIDLYKFIEQNPNKVHKNKSDNEFIFVYWIDLNGLIKVIDTTKCKPHIEQCKEDFISGEIIPSGEQLRLPL